jgi:multimeric flavodoxin WrbA
VPEPLKALAVNCTLKPSPADSSCDLLLSQVCARFEEQGVSTTTVRAVDFDIKPGVRSDEGPGDQWPGIRQQILDAQILVLGTPIWLGHPSSVCQRVLERLDAMLGEQDDDGRLILTDRVAAVVTVGNEDGAHHVAAELYQALVDVGFSVPPSAQVYWVGEAMGGVDYKDLDEVPEKVGQTMRDVARQATHLARVLQASPYPPG